MNAAGQVHKNVRFGRQRAKDHRSTVVQFGGSAGEEHRRGDAGSPLGVTTFAPPITLPGEKPANREWRDSLTLIEAPAMRPRLLLHTTIVEQ